MNLNLILKVVSWRAVSVMTMLATLWLLTGDVGQSTTLTLIVQCVQTVAHAFFEMIWKSIESDEEVENATKEEN